MSSRVKAPDAAERDKLGTAMAEGARDEGLAAGLGALSLGEAAGKSGKKGKKSKNDEKKQLKKQLLQERLAANQAMAKRLWQARFADELGQVPRDVLDGLAPFAKFARNGLDLEIKSFAHGSGVPGDVLSFCFKLTETNMKDKYIEAGWGWNDNKKLRELQDEEARLLVAFDNASGNPVGFLHLRFLREGDELVLYVYELQVDQDKAARKGLGRHLMMIAEVVARKVGMGWVMLTVLQCNPDAKAFYAKLKYTMDETSPQMDVWGIEDEEGEASHVILSKRMPAPKAPPS